MAAAWAYTDATAPVSPGEHIGISRFTVYPERYQVPSRVIGLSSPRRPGGVRPGARSRLRLRLAVRNGQEGPNSVTVDQELFDRYLSDFQEPSGEGEQVIVQPSA